MKRLLILLTATALPCLSGGSARAATNAGFTDSDILFYGEVRQVGGAQAALLQAGRLRMTFVNQGNPANRVTLETELRPTGTGAAKPYSYALKVPLAYLPPAPRIDEFLSIGAEPANFKIEEVTIDGTAATLQDGSKEFYSLSFASRAADYRLDLQVAGTATDSDSDGLPDWWESLYGLDPQLADSSNDLDDDGWSNLEEFRRGSNPALSNRNPQLTSAEILVPESGEAGVYLHILDSDTPEAGIGVTLTGMPGTGFELKVDGVPLAEGETKNLALTEVRAGRVTVHHRERARHQAELSLGWSDDGAAAQGQVLVRATPPGSSDGSDANLWLDGMDLGADGGKIATWNDRSGNGRNALQPLPEHQPEVAGHAADFSRSRSAHLFFQDSALPPGDHTILAAYRAAPSSDVPQTLLATNRGQWQLAPTAQPVSYPGAPVYQMDGLAVRGYENTAGAVVTSVFRREGNLLQNIFGLSYDGENTAAAQLEPVLPTLGARRPALPGGSDPVADAFGGQLHELLVFPTALPEQKLRDAHDYLQSKWGGAVVWDLSTELMAVQLAAGRDGRRHIIRGGFGDDRLAGGPLDDALSGGPGADVLSGGGGSNRFVFGGVDTGKDRITDFNAERDIIDLSALFWGQSGDARQFLAVRLDTNYSTPVPTLDSVLLVQRPAGGLQEIVLENTVIGANRLIQLVVEGRIRAGGLSIPTQVQLALAPGNSAEPLRESLDQAFTVNLSRSGAGTAAALDVPLGFFEATLGGRFVIDGASSNESRRSVVRFARGETSKTLSIRPVPDLDSGGNTTVQVAVLPHYKYAVGGTPVTRSITDLPLAWLEVVQANAVAATGQAARVRVHRNGDLSQGLTVHLACGGTAEQGVHIQSVPDSFTIPAGQSSAEVQVNALATGLTKGPKVVLLQISSRERYQVGNPGEALLYAGATTAETDRAGFDRWLQTASGGALRGLADLAGADPQTRARYLQAYAYGLDSVAGLASHRVSFQIADGRPEILTHSSANPADIRWGVESSADASQWVDDTGTFTEVTEPSGLKLVGEPLPPGQRSRFYRLRMTLDPGPLAGSSIGVLSGTARFGVSGNAGWQPDPASGDLTSEGGNAGGTSRIIAEVGGPLRLDFEMLVPGGGAADALAFYIDGVRQAVTSAAAVRVQRDLTGTGARLLMWEFRRGTGNAVIRNLAR